MWKSPIDTVYHDVEYQFEDHIFKAIQKVDITVDRDELIKALNYDRGQYEKGYEDGKRDATRRGRWVKKYLPKPLSDGSMECYQCSECLTHWTYKTKCCPYCGAEMSEV